MEWNEGLHSESRNAIKSIVTMKLKRLFIQEHLPNYHLKSMKTFINSRYSHIVSPRYLIEYYEKFSNNFSNFCLKLALTRARTSTPTSPPPTTTTKTPMQPG
ncbi:hypothetical protein CHS0354_013507 [Potamilus streckersoni]|uniref:Uncharacterized protein n=1 Tax=Potamilus streckersoni TaxID=2493646 RepID=A0AAE0T8C5_9BIVA|nr:hypothetical protein CHS0354_013507 [Potamilus streckersoni]